MQSALHKLPFYEPSIHQPVEIIHETDDGIGRYMSEKEPIRITYLYLFYNS